MYILIRSSMHLFSYTLVHQEANFSFTDKGETESAKTAFELTPTHDPNIQYI